MVIFHVCLPHGYCYSKSWAGEVVPKSSNVALQQPRAQRPVVHNSDLVLHEVNQFVNALDAGDIASSAKNTSKTTRHRCGLISHWYSVCTIAIHSSRYVDPSWLSHPLLTIVLPTSGTRKKHVIQIVQQMHVPLLTPNHQPKCSDSFGGSTFVRGCSLSPRVSASMNPPHQSNPALDISKSH